MGLLGHMTAYSLFLKDSPYCSLWCIFCAPSPAGFLISFSSLIVVARIFNLCCVIVSFLILEEMLSVFQS